MILLDGVWVPDVPLEVYFFLFFHFLTVFLIQSLSGLSTQKKLSGKPAGDHYPSAASKMWSPVSSSEGFIFLTVMSKDLSFLF